MVALDAETGVSYLMIQMMLIMRETTQLLFEIAGRWPNALEYLEKKVGGVYRSISGVICHTILFQ